MAKRYRPVALRSFTQPDQNPFFQRGVKCRDKGSSAGITVSEDAVYTFRQGWPGSGLPSRSLWFEVDKRNGDLLDLSWPERVTQNAGDALNALMDDAKAVCARRKKWTGLL